MTTESPQVQPPSPHRGPSGPDQTLDAPADPLVYQERMGILKDSRHSEMDYIATQQNIASRLLCSLFASAFYHLSRQHIFDTPLLLCCAISFAVHDPNSQCHLLRWRTCTFFGKALSWVSCAPRLQVLKHFVEFVIHGTLLAPFCSLLIPTVPTTDTTTKSLSQ